MIYVVLRVAKPLKQVFMSDHTNIIVGVTMSEKFHETLAGQILNPKDLIAYQEGSVVSRMIVYKKSGTITLFAFDTNEGLSEHTAPFDAIATIIDGEAEISIEKTPVSSQGRPDDHHAGKQTACPPCTATV